MKLQNSHEIVTQLVELLKGMSEPNAAAASVLSGLFEELSEALSAENREQDVTKIRKASVFCEQIADGSLDEAASEWEWIQSTARAVAKVVTEGVDFANAGYPEKGDSHAASNFGSLVDADIYAEFISRQSEAIEEIEHVSMEIEAGRIPEDTSAIMRLFHTLKGESALLGLEGMSRLSHMSEDMLTTEPIADCAERLLLVKDWLYHEFLHLTGDADAPEAVDQLIAKLSMNSIQSAAEVAKPSSTPQPLAKIQRKDAVRVDSDRLDLLVETIGELVIAEAMVSQSDELRSTASVEMARNLDHLDKICRELQEIGMSLRMVPVRPTFQKMARLVRDLSKKIGRKIDFEIEGEETELDKSVVDKIGDPLVHMIRNAVDHGIESNPGERMAAGKPEAGRIQLKAFHKGGNIVIEVVDDGKGLDRDVIMAKAIERGLIKEGQIMTDREVFSLIFEPGFSTAKKVTDVSGRGVGMDVVRRNIDELRGSVEIDSEKGKGSTFRFKLPLTLAIIDGMVIKTGTENYIIPTLTVVRLVRPNKDDYSTVREKGEMLRFEEDLIPLFRLNHMFKVKDACDDLAKAVVVVVESDGRKIGLMTDNLVGQQQIVIKSLGEQVQGTPGIAGGAIMSNGNVALILDVAGLVKIAHVEGTTRGMDRAANK